MEKKLLITIDGPAGAGKSSVSKALAEILSYLYLDTGALYRAVAYKLKKENRNADDRRYLTDLPNSLDLNLAAKNGVLRVVLDNEDITDILRSEELGLMASTISAFPIIREILLPIQRQFGSYGGIIAEGRDMGTVVFPQADLKYFLTASPSERAWRRHRELLEAGCLSDLVEVRDQMIQRDRQDAEREVAPLKIPEDAVLIDSTDLSIQEIVAIMCQAVKTKSI